MQYLGNTFATECIYIEVSNLGERLKKSMIEVTFKIIPKDELPCILSFLKKLDDAISEEILEERLSQMADNNYQCVGVYNGEHLIGISGLWILNKYYVGKHLEPDDVFILPEYQSQGIGHKLVEWIERYALKQGCRAIELNCYQKNKKALKFWEREGYSPIGIHYQKIFKEIKNETKRNT